MLIQFFKLLVLHECFHEYCGLVKKERLTMFRKLHAQQEIPVVNTSICSSESDSDQENSSACCPTAPPIRNPPTPLINMGEEGTRRSYAQFSSSFPPIGQSSSGAGA
jgi:hypothetical protein